MSRSDPAQPADAVPVPGLPRDPEGAPVFHEPWQAQAFAMALELHRRGLFTWPEWTAALAREIARAHQRGDRDAGDTYYAHWLATLERIVAEKDLVDGAGLAGCREAWARAARRTPHGEPIVLAPGDFDR